MQKLTDLFLEVPQSHWWVTRSASTCKYRKQKQQLDNMRHTSVLNHMLHVLANLHNATEAESTSLDIVALICGRPQLQIHVSHIPSLHVLQAIRTLCVAALIHI